MFVPNHYYVYIWTIFPRTLMLLPVLLNLNVLYNIQISRVFFPLICFKFSRADLPIQVSTLYFEILSSLYLFFLKNQLLYIEIKQL